MAEVLKNAPVYEAEYHRRRTLQGKFAGAAQDGSPEAKDKYKHKPRGTCHCYRCAKCNRLGHISQACRAMVDKDTLGRIRQKVETNPSKICVRCLESDTPPYPSQSPAGESKEGAGAGRPREASAEGCCPSPSGSALLETSEEDEDEEAASPCGAVGEHGVKALALDITINAKPCTAVVDTGAWRSIVTKERAPELGIIVDPKRSIKLQGLGRHEAQESEPTLVEKDGKSFMVRFCIVQQFPFPVCIGLADLLRWDTISRGLHQMSEARPFSPCGAVKLGDLSYGSSEASDQLLLKESRLTLRGKCGAQVGDELFDKIWRIFEKHLLCWLKPKGGPPVRVEVVGPPTKAARRPLSPAMKEEVEKQVKMQLAAGVIEPLRSPWASAIHFIPKPGDRWRIVIDYRDVNAKIKADTYPIPLIQEILHEVEGHKFIIKLDLMWGSWNQPLEEGSRECLAFTTHMGLFQPRVLPFGMRNSPSEFQRMMDKVFGSLYPKGLNTTVLGILEEILRISCEKGIYINLAKSEILKEETPVLGHLVSEQGIRPNPERIQGLRDARRRDFVPAFSQRTAPLRGLVKKRAAFDWGPAHDEAFEDIKNAVYEGVTLHGPKGRGPFVLVSDASDAAVGGALLQSQEGNLIPIAFFSKSAIKVGLERNKNLIRGHKIFVFTDHKSLQWAKDATQSKIQRWMWFFNQFNLSIHHISGEFNGIADWLSRSKEELTADDEEILDQVALPLACALPLPSITLPTLSALRKASAEAPQEETRLCTKGRDDRHSMLFWFHCGPTGGHRGINSTSRKMKKYIWWQGLEHDVKKFVGACLQCSRNRSPTINTTSMVLRRPTPFDLVSADFVGPRKDHVGETWHYLVLIDHCSRFIMTAATQFPSGDFAAAVLRNQWAAVFGSPLVVLVHCSPYYPQGNAINESHANFQEILRDVTNGYNASYQSSIGDAPHAILFGKPPVLPGFQPYALVTPEIVRREALKEKRARDLLMPHVEEHGELKEMPARSTVLEGDFVLFPRADHERLACTDAPYSLKYSPQLSLPAKVLRVGKGTATVVEYGTGRQRQVPLSSVRKLPVELPPELIKLNWEYMNHFLPRRWRYPATAQAIPTSYEQIARAPTQDEWIPQESPEILLCNS
eukprot:GHVN01013897.1.p1 GENE.GHVN01013897.1~~GHVN01013897.1.p1  ORF type:complete len:1133 (+),score=49.16 GHVN01013897.1:160-3558(+)